MKEKWMKNEWQWEISQGQTSTRSAPQDASEPDSKRVWEEWKRTWKKSSKRIDLISSLSCFWLNSKVRLFRFRCLRQELQIGCQMLQQLPMALLGRIRRSAKADFKCDAPGAVAPVVFGAGWKVPLALPLALPWLWEKLSRFYSSPFLVLEMKQECAATTIGHESLKVQCRDRSTHHPLQEYEQSAYWEHPRDDPGGTFQSLFTSFQ